MVVVVVGGQLLRTRFKNPFCKGQRGNLPARARPQGTCEQVSAAVSNTPLFTGGLVPVWPAFGMKRELLDAYLGMVQEEFYVVTITFLDILFMGRPLRDSKHQTFHGKVWSVQPMSRVSFRFCNFRFCPCVPGLLQAWFAGHQDLPTPGFLPPEVSLGGLCCSSPNFGVLSSHSFQEAGVQAPPGSRWSLERRGPSHPPGQAVSRLELILVSGSVVFA